MRTLTLNSFVSSKRKFKNFVNCCVLKALKYKKVSINSFISHLLYSTKLNIISRFPFKIFNIKVYLRHITYLIEYKNFFSKKSLIMSKFFRHKFLKFFESLPLVLLKDNNKQHLKKVVVHHFILTFLKFFMSDDIPFIFD